MGDRENTAIILSIHTKAPPDELGDTQTMGETLRMAQEEVTAVEPDAEVHEVVADKGYHSNETVLELKALD